MFSKPSIAGIPETARRQLAVDFGVLIERLSRHLARQRRRGRSPAGDAVQGFLIEDGEAEGLIAELTEAWSQPSRLEKADSRRERPPGIAPWPFEILEARRSALPLHRVAREFRLEGVEFAALLLAMAVELDGRFARLVAYLNDHAGRTRPTLGLALALADIEGGDQAPSPIELVDRPLFRDGLLDLEGDDPLTGQSLRVPRDVLRRLVSGEWLSPEGPGLRLDEVDLGLLGRLVLDDPTRSRLATWATSARRGEGPVSPLILVGPPGRGRSTVARGVVAEIGLPLVTVELEAAERLDRLKIARRESRWYGAALLLKLPDRPQGPFDWREIWAGLAEVRAPLLLAVPEDLVEPASAASLREPAVVRLEEPGVALRARLWRALLPRGEPIEDEVLDTLAARFRFSAGWIARAIRRARVEVALRPPGERRLSGDDLARACREVGGSVMGPLSEKLPLPYARHELVVPDRINAELDLAVAWVRHQRQVLERWGFERRLPMGRGLTVLFAGPPGTGKTMAAQVLARELGVDLFRIDLSRVLSKYIGETEERLRQVFDEAHLSGAALFFDEADALFGKRTEVKDAHDRYANVEISYLLQRMEAYDGVTILATNRKRDVDEAFVRRFQFLVDFPMPGEADRLRIWQGMFPPEAEREPGLDLSGLARGFEVSGGEIKNAVLAAAFLAAADGTPVTMNHLTHALRRELTKSGRVLDEREFRSLSGS